MKSLQDLKNLGLKDLVELLLIVYDKVKIHPINKITIAVVVIATGLISKPFWQEVLNSIMKKQYSIAFIGENDSLYGFYLLIAALTYNVISHAILIFGEYLAKRLKYKLIDSSVPFWQELDNALQEYRIVLNTYFSCIVNKGDSCGSFESDRNLLDERILKAIEKLAFFLKPDEEKLLRKIRHFTSAKFYPELNLYNHFWETYNMAPSIFTNEASTIFKDYFNAYRTLKDNFIAGKDLDIISILEKNSIDKQIEPIFKSAEAKIAMNELFFDGGHRY